MPKEKEQNPADNYKQDMNVAVEGLIAESKKAKLVKKKVKLTYKELKTNVLLVQRIKLLGGSGIVDASGEAFNNAEESVYKVIMAGKATDEFHIQPKVGDLVLINGFITEMHRNTTEVITRDGQDLSYYLAVALNNVIAIVDYEKL